MSAFEPGHAFSSIDAPESQVSAFEPAFRQAILAFTADDLVDRFGLAAPDHLKVDVDGAEIEILQGAETVLRKVRSVIMEVEGNNAERFEEEILPLMERAGLALPDGDGGRGRNRLFVRPGS